MRSLLGLTASLLLPLAAAGAQAPPAGERYLPPALVGDAEDAEFFESWLGRELSAMGEPVLLGAALPRDVVRRFRMVTTINHRGSRAIRVDQLRTGGARVRAVEIGGVGRVPRIVREESYDIDRDDVAEFVRALQLSRLDRMEPVAPLPAADAEAICIPFTHFFFELVEAGGSRFVTRDACETSPRLNRLFETLHPLRARTR